VLTASDRAFDALQAPKPVRDGATAARLGERQVAPSLPPMCATGSSEAPDSKTKWISLTHDCVDSGGLGYVAAVVDLFAAVVAGR